MEVVFHMKQRKNSLLLRIVSVVAAVLLCLSVVSCGDGDAPGADASDTWESTETPETEPETEKVLLHGDNPDNPVWAEAYLKALPVKDFEGATFFITSTDTTMFDPDGVSFVSETVARRNEALEKKYNISVSCAETDINTMAKESTKAILAGLYYTDIMAIPFDETGAFASAGLLTNLRSLPHFDTDKPYFNESSVDALSVGYNIYGVAGEATPAASELPVVVFNKTLADSLGSGDLYGDALAGRFTWDRFFEAASLADTAEEAGVVCTTGAPAEYIFASVGQRFIESREMRVPTVGFANYSMDEAASILRRIREKSSLSGVSPEGAVSVFSSGYAMFSICNMNELDKYRTDAVEMGILPMPKSSEEDSYRSLVGPDALILTVTRGSTNSELVSLALSGLCAASYGYINEEYADYLHATTLPDNRSASVVELITKSAYYDLSTAFASTVPGLTSGTRGLVSGIMESGDFTSFAAVTEELNRTLAAYFPLDN